jgi:hypothetical protein
MTKLADLKKEFLSDPNNKIAYDALEPEFSLSRKLIVAGAVAVAGLSQAEVAERKAQSRVSFLISKAHARTSVSKSCLGLLML